MRLVVVLFAGDGHIIMSLVIKMTRRYNYLTGTNIR